MEKGNERKWTKISYCQVGPQTKMQEKKKPKS